MLLQQMVAELSGVLCMHTVNPEAGCAVRVHFYAYTIQYIVGGKGL